MSFCLSHPVLSLLPLGLCSPHFKALQITEKKQSSQLEELNLEKVAAFVLMHQYNYFIVVLAL